MGKLRDTEVGQLLHFSLSPTGKDKIIVTNYVAGSGREPKAIACLRDIRVCW